MGYLSEILSGVCCNSAPPAFQSPKKPGLNRGKIYDFLSSQFFGHIRLVCSKPTKTCPQLSK